MSFVSTYKVVEINQLFDFATGIVDIWMSSTILSWKSDDHLKISLTAVDQSGKFRFAETLKRTFKNEFANIQFLMAQ